MTEGTQNNSWVESYLEALLSNGLSTEYSKAPQQQPGRDMVDADRDKYAKFYVHQILNMGEEGIRDAYRKAVSTQHYSEADARLEYLAWRTWFMKRAHSNAQLQRAKKVTLEDLQDDAMVDMESSTSGDDEGHLLDAAAKAGRPISRPQSVDEKRPLDMSAEAAMGMAPAAPPKEPTSSTLVMADSLALGMGMGALRVDTVKKPSRRVEALVDLDTLTPVGDGTSEAGDPFAGRVDGLYIVLISLHGLVRGQHMELGRDADTGGQVKYVVELARAIASHPAVHRVELLTRLVQDPKVSPDYGQEEECILRGDGDMGGAFIVRLPAGDPKVYLRKEQLWPHVREFADRGISHVAAMLRRLQEASEPCSLYTIHGHYADAGEVAALMALTMTATEDCDMVMTGHSLGRNKLEHLLATGTTSKEEIEANYKISRRIEAEERALDTATMVFTSTQQEVDEQWGLYDGYDRQLEPVLRSRHKSGRHMPFMNVVPPGLDFSNLKVDLPEDPNLKGFAGSKPAFVVTPRACDSPFRTSSDKGDPAAPTSEAAASDLGLVPAPPAWSQPSSPATPHGHATPSSHDQGESIGRPTSAFSVVLSTGGGSEEGGTPRGLLSPTLKSMRHSENMLHMQPLWEENPHIWQEIGRFLKNPRKPAILAMSRPDAKKNITTLVNAFGKHPMLRELANLVLIMGNRDNIDSMAAGSQKVLTQVMKLIDLHDLYGSVAYPKKHSQDDISDIYRLPLATHGIFTNIALQEPFGLTVIEAAAHGVPTVATRNGGPVDIMKTLHHGVVVDPTDEAAVAQALLNILTDRPKWETMSKNGVKNIHAYSWLAHARKYLESIAKEKKCLSTQKKFGTRLSGNWDLRTGGSMEHPKSSSGTPLAGLGSAQNGFTFSMDRTATMPPPSAAVDFLTRAAGKMGYSAALSPLGSPAGQASGLRLAAAARAAMELEDLDAFPRGFSRDGFVVVPLDGLFRGAAVAAALKKVGQEIKDSGANTGIGIVTMLGFEDTIKCLKAHQVSLEGIDWVLCHGGADIWHAMPDRDSGRMAWETDEQWERHIDWRWERASLARLLAKVAVAQKEGPAGRRLPLLTAMASAELCHLEEAKQERGIHPHHISMELDAAAKDALGQVDRTSKGGLPSTAIVDRLRRRLRCNGFRAHLTLQMVPGGASLLSRVGLTSAPLVSCIHVTPLRASRALGLRFLAHKFGICLDRFTLLLVAPTAVPTTDDALLVGSNTSDLAELLGGLLHVRVATPDSPDSVMEDGHLSASDRAAFGKMSALLSKKMFGKRVDWGKAGESLGIALSAGAADGKLKE